MAISKEVISALEKLAKLQLSEVEKAKMVEDITNIMDMIDQLNEVDTSGVEPLAYVNDQYQRLREDEVTGQLSQKEALKNAPEADDRFFKVKKFLDL